MKVSEQFKKFKEKKFWELQQIVWNHEKSVRGLEIKIIDLKERINKLEKKLCQNKMND